MTSRSRRSSDDLQSLTNSIYRNDVQLQYQGRPQVVIDNVAYVVEEMIARTFP